MEKTHCLNVAVQFSKLILYIQSKLNQISYWLCGHVRRAVLVTHFKKNKWNSCPLEDSKDLSGGRGDKTNG